jgi:hypothetical protein
MHGKGHRSLTSPSWAEAVYPPCMEQAGYLANMHVVQMSRRLQKQMIDR